MKHWSFYGNRKVLLGGERLYITFWTRVNYVDHLNGFIWN